MTLATLFLQMCASFLSSLIHLSEQTIPREHWSNVPGLVSSSEKLVEKTGDRANGGMILLLGISVRRG